MKGLGKQTIVITVNAKEPVLHTLEPAAEALRKGGVVAFPTETVYGLGANAMDAMAVTELFRAKGRPSDNPLIVHVADRAMIGQVVATLPAVAERLIERFWPGPLTLVLPKAPAISDRVTCGLNTVGVRMPAHSIALALIRAAGVPVAAPSANLSGRPSPTAADHVLTDLDGRIDLIVDGGETGVGLESTVLDVTLDPPMLLRPGGVTLEELCAEIGPITVGPSIAHMESGESPRSPGTKYTHYAPHAMMVLVDGPMLRIQAKIQDLIDEYSREGQRVGVLCSAESRGVYQAPIVLEFGTREDLAGIASDLFATLRAFDRHDVQVILSEGVPTHGIGLAIMDRLRRAAGGRVVTV